MDVLDLLKGVLDSVEGSVVIDEDGKTKISITKKGGEPHVVDHRRVSDCC